MEIVSHQSWHDVIGVTGNTLALVLVGVGVCYSSHLCSLSSRIGLTLLVGVEVYSVFSTLENSGLFIAVKLEICSLLL